MAVVQVRNESKCKICSSPHRVEIDGLLEMRSRRMRDGDGNLVNAQYVMERMADVGIENPTIENISVHWRKHCEIAGDDSAPPPSLAEEMEKRRDAIEAHFGSEWRTKIPSAQDVLDFLLLIGLSEAGDKFIEGKPLGASFEHLIKTVEAKTRRKQDEATGKLLEALGTGIERGLAQAIAPAVRPALPPPDVDIEPEEVSDETA